MTFSDAGRRRVAALLLCFPFGSAAFAQETEPFRTRNLSPLVSIFGIPAWQTAADKTRVELTSDLANHYRLSRRGDEVLILDGETWRNSISLRHGFGRGWTAGVEIPYYQQSGGMLDDLIDGWHSVFGMPDGGRNSRAEDQLIFLLADEAGPFFALDRRARGIGDVQLSIGRSIGRDRGFLLSGSLKLPTGQEELLAGSGSTDWSVTLLRSKQTALGDKPAAFFWGAGAIGIGEPELIEYDTRSAAFLGMFGGSLKPWPRLGFKLQADIHSALYDSRLNELGDPGVQVTLGGWREIGAAGVFEFAVNEDLAVSTSPDVVLHLTLRWDF